jgi:ribosomal protein L21
MKPEKDILTELYKFFESKFTVEKNNKGYKYAIYKESWLRHIKLTKNDADEAKSARTTRELQNYLLTKFGTRIKVEAPVAEGMTLRFDTINGEKEEKIDYTKLQAFDVLDLESGTAFEISLSDAFAEFFKDVLKALLDSRVKNLYICMRNHTYKGAGKSGFIKVASSEMVRQYISLAKLYKLDIFLIDLFPKCNQ